MSILYRTSDRIDVKVDDLEVVISPLSFAQKTVIQNSVLEQTAEGATKGAALAIKYSVKGIRGIKTMDGKDYEVEFDSDGNLTDECLDDLLNISHSQKIMIMSLNLINGVPKEFVNPETNEKLEGVSFLGKKRQSRRK